MLSYPVSYYNIFEQCMHKGIMNLYLISFNKKGEYTHVINGIKMSYNGFKRMYMCRNFSILELSNF